MVILIGYPASGKSTYTTTVLKDFKRINRDELKTMPKCIKECEKELLNDNSVVIDNLNHTHKSRKDFIDLAKKHNVWCVGIHINTSFQQAEMWNNQRENKVPKIVFYTYRKNFENPSLEEGFDELYVII